MSATATSPAYDSSATEADLVQCILAKPAARAGFVALAEFLETQGNVDDAKVLYRGNVPTSIREKYNLENMPSAWSHEMPDYEPLGWHPAESLTFDPVINDDPQRDACFDQLQTKTPTNYCGILNHATLVFDGNNRLVIDRHGVRNKNYSTVNSFLLAAQLNNQALRLNGTTLLLSARNSHNFYHWQMECLPLLGMLSVAGIPLDDIDHFLLNRKDASFQLHTLKLLGVDESRIVWIDTLPATFECERLALCRLTNSMGMAYRAGNIDWLRNQPWVGKSSATSVTAPAAKHKLAIRRDVRGFTQNDVIYESLAQRGYRVVYPEHYAYEEQVSLFRHASHIVAPHGAALSLLTYAAPDTEVHEFYGAHVHPCFYAISAMLGQRYYNYNCAPSPVTEASDNTAGNTATGNKGLSERLRQSIDLDPAMLETINL